MAEALPSLSRERLKSLIKGGRVVDANGAVLWDPSAKGRCTRDDRGSPACRGLPAHNVAQDMDLAIAFEDEHLIVVDKPAGMVVHPAAGNLDGTMVNALLHHCAGQLSGIGGVARPGIVHRIDKDTSGLIVAAKHDKAHEGSRSSSPRTVIDRRYLRACDRAADARRTERSTPHWADRPQTARRWQWSLKDAANTRSPHYRTIEPLKNATLVECRLETGRTHQVRVHMAHIGHPLVRRPRLRAPT